jgi:hypothetical protein
VIRHRESYAQNAEKEIVWRDDIIENSGKIRVINEF